LRIFGCIPYALIRKEFQHTLESHSHECIYFEYSERSKVYRLQVKSTIQIIISRDVTFDETSVHSPHNDIHIKLVNQMHDFLLNQNFLKSFIGLPQLINLNIIPNLPFPLPSSIQPMNPSPSHITLINSTTSLINSNNFPSPIIMYLTQILISLKKIPN